MNFLLLRRHQEHQDRLKKMLAEVRAWVRHDAVPLTISRGGDPGEEI
jgi:hypothetical protein